MKQKHVDMLARLMKLTNCQEDLVDFMKHEKLITGGEIGELLMEHDKAKYICKLLFEAQSNEKLQLLSFDWVVLPVERLRLKLVTDMSTKEFVYHY